MDFGSDDADYTDFLSEKYVDLSNFVYYTVSNVCISFNIFENILYNIILKKV